MIHPYFRDVIKEWDRTAPRADPENDSKILEAISHSIRDNNGLVAIRWLVTIIIISIKVKLRNETLTTDFSFLPDETFVCRISITATAYDRWKLYDMQKTTQTALIEEFKTALCSDKRSKRIPEKYDYFGCLIGKWDIEWIDHLNDTTPRQVKGEWIFSWVLDGTAVQDLFIVPCRGERLVNRQPDAEYGTTLRIFNPKTLVWDIFYGCSGEAIRLTARKIGNDIVLTEKMRYVFSDITGSAFYWRKEQMNDTEKWEIVAKIKATKKYMSSRSC